jgi:hypothetical protein
MNGTEQIQATHEIKDATITITDGKFEFVLEAPRVELTLYALPGADVQPMFRTLYTHFEGEAEKVSFRMLPEDAPRKPVCRECGHDLSDHVHVDTEDDFYSGLCTAPGVEPGYVCGCVSSL